MNGKILIVDDVATNRIVLKVKLAEAGYQPLLAADGASCLALAQRDLPNLILLDHMLPDMTGTEVVKRLRADPALRAIPIVMFSASQNHGAMIAAFRAGADEFLTKPIDDHILLARIRSFLRARDALEGFSAPEEGMALLGLAEAPATFRPAGQIALVFNRPETALQVRRDIAAHMSDRVQILSADEALSVGQTSTGVPDIFLIETDYRSPGGGLRLMSDLRSRTHSRNAAVCLMAPQGHANAAVAYDLGANDLVSTAASGEEIALRLQRLLHRKREADDVRARVQNGLRMAMIDPLTGLHNRRFGLAQLDAIATAARKSGQGFAVMVVDLDRFKSVNDRWGHAAGDAVLVEVAKRLAANLRAGDLLARIGGEEFLIALPDANLAIAQSIAERLCLAMQERRVRIADVGALRITVSIGLAVSAGPQPCEIHGTCTEIVKRADHALMQAKSSGRNQVTTSQTAA